jgi:hypothetical protein
VSGTDKEILFKLKNKVMKKDFLKALKYIYVFCGVLAITFSPIIIAGRTGRNEYYLLLIITFPIALALYVAWIKKIL